MMPTFECAINACNKKKGGKREEEEDDDDDEEKSKNTLPPYSITASCQDYGMGCVSWWD